MRKIKLFYWLLLFLFIVSCNATTGGSKPVGVSETSVLTYEMVALSLNTAKGYIKGQELSGALKGAELDAAIAKWEMGRKLFLQAGDTLAQSINSTTEAERKSKMQLYNQMLQQAGQIAGQFKGGGK